MFHLISNLRTYLRLRDEKKVPSPSIEIFGVLARNLPFTEGTITAYSVIKQADDSLIITLTLTPEVDDPNATAYLYPVDIDYAFDCN